MKNFVIEKRGVNVRGGYDPKTGGVGGRGGG